MTTQTSTSNRKALLSHLTLAGAAVLTAGASHSGDAQIISGTINQYVGFNTSTPDLSSVTIPLVGSQNNGTYIRFYTSVSGSYHAIFEHDKGFSSVLVRSTARHLLVGPAGQTFSAVGGTTSVFATVNRATATGVGSVNTFSDQYMAFKIDGSKRSGSTDYYGWVELSLLNNTYGNMELYVGSYAYDTTGAPLATGALTAAVPEPSPAIVLAAFGALILGAAGVRRLKALQN